MKFFTRDELYAVLAILLLIFLGSYYNFNMALLRARDAQRRADLGSISNALHAYYSDFGFVPDQIGGKIKACKGENYQEAIQKLKDLKKFDREIFFEGLSACEWGQDSIKDLLETDETYMKTLPIDPMNQKGIKYLYLANGRRFQIYAYLEEEEKAIGYNQGIVDRGLDCGGHTCNFGKTLFETPLEKSIEEYENELRQRQLEQQKQNEK